MLLTGGAPSRHLWQRLEVIVRDGSNKCVGLDREGKKQFLELATAVYQALSASGARVRLVAFAEHWRATQPQAVATFEREFEQTIRYYSLEGIARGGAHPLTVGTHQSRIAAEVSAGRLFVGDGQTGT